MDDETSAKNKPSKEPTPYDPPATPGAAPSISVGHVALIFVAGMIGPLVMMLIHLGLPYVLVGVPVGWATQRAAVATEDRRYVPIGVGVCLLACIAGWFLGQVYGTGVMPSVRLYWVASLFTGLIPYAWTRHATAHIFQRQYHKELHATARELYRAEREGRLAPLPPKKVSTAKLRAACTHCGALTDAELLVKRVCPACRDE
jgi:hypothetical protein